MLRAALWARGLRYRVDTAALPGRPDLTFVGARVVVFCDGDFWHGRDLALRLKRLKRGHNAPYWIAKITGNVARDRRNDAELHRGGWIVMRYWETDIASDCNRIADEIAATVYAQKLRRTQRPR